MTRGEEIRKAIDKIIPIPPSEKGRNYKQSLMAAGFEAGAQWADDNPKSPWISVDDDLPCNHEELMVKRSSRTKEVLVLIEDAENNFAPKVISMIFDDITWEWIWEINYWMHNSRVTHWMPIPKLPKE